MTTPLKISEAFTQAPQTYCYCENCKQLFIDDIPMYGGLYCPYCKPFCVIRGITKDELANLATDQDENEEIGWDELPIDHTIDFNPLIYSSNF
jgi:hypothetical protein